MHEEWLTIWRGMAMVTTGHDPQSVKGKKICALLKSGDVATQKKDLGLLRMVRSQLHGVLRHDPTTHG